MKNILFVQQGRRPKARAKKEPAFRYITLPLCELELERLQKKGFLNSLLVFVTYQKFCLEIFADYLLSHSLDVIHHHHRIFSFLLHITHNFD